MLFITGSVDAFAAVLGPRPSSRQPVVTGQVFKFDVVKVNIRGGYNPNSGKNICQLVNGALEGVNMSARLCTIQSA